MIDEFATSRQGKGESLDMFVARVEQLGDRLGCSMQDVKERVLRGLSVEYMCAAVTVRSQTHEDTDDLIEDIKDTARLIRDTQQGGKFANAGETLRFSHG